MNKLKEPKFDWDGQTAKCTISYGKKDFIGTASCHPDDQDFISEKTGCNIAFLKAQIKYYKYLRDCYIPKVSTLSDILASFHQSKKTNKKSYEYKFIKRQYNILNTEFEVIKTLLKSRKKDLRDYLQQKEQFKAKIRMNRKKKAQDTNK